MRYSQRPSVIPIIAHFTINTYITFLTNYKSHEDKDPDAVSLRAVAPASKVVPNTQKVPSDYLLNELVGGCMDGTNLVQLVI